MKPEDNRNPEDIDMAARVAALWWRKALEGRRPSNVGDGMANLMIGLVQASVATPNKSALDIFQEELKNRLVEQLTRCGQAWLSVDYGPEGMLADAFDKANARGCFPCKSHMTVYPGDVTVACGYHAPTERLLGLPLWRVERYDPSQPYASGKRYVTLYHGKDGTQAKQVFADERKLHPGIRVNEDYDDKQLHLSIRRDSNYVDTSV